MTREEALQIIYDHCQHCDETEKAFEILKENKGDLISRQAVLDIWHTSYSDIRVENEEIQYKKIAFELPSVENKGEWKEEFKGGRKLCSNCGIFNNSKYKNFCPNCGSDMRGVSEWQK